MLFCSCSFHLPWNQCISWFFGSIMGLQFGIFPFRLTFFHGGFSQVPTNFLIIQGYSGIFVNYLIGLGGNHNVLSRYDMRIFCIFTFEQLLFSSVMKKFFLISNWIFYIFQYFLIYFIKWLRIGQDKLIFCTTFTLSVKCSIITITRVLALPKSDLCTKEF